MAEAARAAASTAALMTEMHRQPYFLIVNREAWFPDQTSRSFSLESSGSAAAVPARPAGLARSPTSNV
jgi:hypothetical protein